MPETSGPQLWLCGGTVLAMDDSGSSWEDAAVGIRDGKISFVGPRAQATIPPQARILDATHCLVTPGFVNSHTHTGMTLLRGIADDYPLDIWLRRVIFPIEEKWGTREFVYLGTLLAAVEMIRSGTTTFNDMYYHEEMAAKASAQAGLRHVAGQTLVEISGVENASGIFDSFDEFLDNVSAYPLVRPAIAPHSIYGVSRRTWEKILEYATRRNLFIHTHLAETQEEMNRCLQTFGKTPAAVFEELGLWSQQVIAAHATCVSEADIEILGRYRVGIAHNPESNLKLGSKISPVVELRRAGCPVALGTDSTASNNNLDLLQEADTAAKLQTFRLGVGALKAPDTVRMLTIEGARALGLGDRTGSLEVGKAADVIAIDTNRAHAIPLYDAYSHLIYSAAGGDVKHSVVDGQVLMENYRLCTLDESAILAEAREWGRKIARDRLPAQ